MSTETKKKSPNLDLRTAEGNYIVGEFIGRYESKNYPGKFSSLIKVEELEGSTKLWNTETKKEEEIDVEAGDSVFLSESSWLAVFFSKLEKGQRIRVEYLGKAKPTKKGYKGAYTYKSEVL